MTDTDTTYTDRAIHSLRAHHDLLAKLVAGLSPEELAGQSAAAKWSIAHVLSHLGSGAEIWFVPFAAGIAGEPAPQRDDQPVWARWDAGSEQEQVDAFVEHSQRFVALLEALTPEQRRSVRIDVGFLPEPVPLEEALGMRLNEVGAHTWDVVAGLDPTAPLDAEAAELALEYFTGAGALILDFAGKADRLDGSAAVDLGGYTLVIDDSVKIVAGAPGEATAVFEGPHEAAVRLLLGRLKPGYTAEDIAVRGSVGLDDLRRVFPGY